MGRKLALLAVLAIGLFLRLSPLSRTPLLIGADGYYHYRTAASLLDSGSVPEWDEYSFGGRPHIYPPGFHLLAGAFTLLSGLSLRQVALFTGPLFYVFSSLLASLYSPVSSFFLSTIPVYVWRTTTNFLVSSLWTFLIYCLVRMRAKKVAVLMGIALAFTHSSALVALPLLAILHRNRKRSALFWFATVLASVWWLDVQSPYQNVPFALRSQIFEGASFTKFAWRSGPQGLLSLLGIPGGGILAVTWTAVFAAFVSAGLMELDRAIEASGLVVAALADRATPRIFVPLLVVVSSLWAYQMMGALDWGYISPDERTALDWIRENSAPHATVASTLGEGYWVEGYLGRKNVMDGHFATMEDVEERMEGLETIFSASPRPALEKYDVSFVFASQKAVYEYGFQGYEGRAFESGSTDVYAVGWKT